MLRGDDLEHLLTLVQDGVVSRSQLLACGGDDNDIERMVRRRELTVVHRGVYVNHSGPLTRAQRECAAVLICGPSALSHESALGIGSPDAPVQVAVAAGRSVRAPGWVVVHRSAHLHERIDPLTTPPRIRLPQAALDVACRRSPSGAFTVLADVLRTRRTSTTELRAAIAGRERLRGRAMLLAMLDDLDTGATSVLERGYLSLVERPHGLPRMERQVRDRVGGRTIYRDGEYARFGLVVELDGRAFHGRSGRWASDSVRDLETLAGRGQTTVRLTYHQVFDVPCRTAQLVGRILATRGWAGQIVSCERCGAPSV